MTHPYFYDVDKSPPDKEIQVLILTFIFYTLILIFFLSFKQSL